MGKYALILVAAFSMAGARIAFSGQETDVKSAQSQGEYDADLIAHEVARSAFNAAMSDVSIHGSDIPGALEAIGTPVISALQDGDGKCANNVPVCYRREGSMQGGIYRVEASVNGGNGVDLFTRGQYAYSAVQDSAEQPNYGQSIRRLKTYEINETRSVGVLQVARSGRLSIQFVDSQAGYCSAIFLQRTLPGVPAALQPKPEMVYAPGKNRNGDRNSGYETILEPGTQMNFGIGVDNSCNGDGSRPNSRPDLRMKAAGQMLTRQGPASLAAAMASYRYSENDWSWVHWALDSGSLLNGNPQEGPWGMVETDPINNQRWRISFEDIHEWNLPATHPRYNDPRESLWATKRFGYDTNNDGVGDGWKDLKRIVVTPNGNSGSYRISEENGQDGFHDLRNTGRPADFSDQVIFVTVEPLPATTAVPA